MKRHELRIEADYLTRCSPEAAYDWLEQKSKEVKAETGSYRYADRETKLLEWMLLRRRHRLIDLGIARYGKTPFAIRRAFLRGDVGVRCAAWSNPIAASRSMLADGWYKHEDLKRLVDVAPKSEIEAFASNPAIGDQWLEDLIQRKGVFKDLSLSKYVRALGALSENPRLGAPYDESRPMDGWAEYMHGRGSEAAWSLTTTLPVDQFWAAVLEQLIRNCPRPSLLKDVDATIARWRIDPPVKEGARSFWRGYSFHLRSRLADPKKADQDLLGSDDLALRMSFYRRFVPWEFKDWPSFLERDGHDFVESAIENDQLWRSKDERERLSRVCWNAPDPSYDMMLPNYYRAAERRMRKMHPEWFYDEDDEFSSKQDAVLRRVERKVDELAKRIEDISDRQPFRIMESRAASGADDDRTDSALSRIERQIKEIVEHLEQLSHRTTVSPTQASVAKMRSIPGWVWFVAGALVVLILRSLY